MNRRAFTQFLAISGLAPLGWAEGALNMPVALTAGRPLDSTLSLPVPSFKPGRRIESASAVLLPFADRDQIDWESFGNLLERTWIAGLTPAVNMDTGM